MRPGCTENGCIIPAEREQRARAAEERVEKAIERECETEIKRQRDEGAKERRRKRGERANRGS